VQSVHYQIQAIASGEPTLDEKVTFLSRPDAYSPPSGGVERRETHMSWIFLTDDRAYKLKKPVRLPYLDFSTLERREAACREELRLNRRLAPDVYLDVAALVNSAQGLSINGSGVTVDWLVVMRRLDEHYMLDHMITKGRLTSLKLDRLATTLIQFYRCATPVFTDPARNLAEWKAKLAFNRRILLDPRFNLPAGLIRHVDGIQRRFLVERQKLLAARVRGRHIVDGHGDLRPEHIWLGDPIRIIDCLEFNPRLRAVDPFDEIAFLSLECEHLGARWVGDYVRRCIIRKLHGDPTEELFTFYRCHRGMLRARLAIAHLLESNPRTPEKWPPLARAYLGLAAKDAVQLERLLRARGDR
jgi:aminoglycoside phosphotransferase family enzyme